MLSGAATFRLMLSGAATFVPLRSQPGTALLKSLLRCSPLPFGRHGGFMQICIFLYKIPDYYVWRFAQQRFGGLLWNVASLGRWWSSPDIVPALPENSEPKGHQWCSLCPTFPNPLHEKHVDCDGTLMLSKHPLSLFLSLALSLSLSFPLSLSLSLFLSLSRYILFISPLLPAVYMAWALQKARSLQQWSCISGHMWQFTQLCHINGLLHEPSALKHKEWGNTLLKSSIHKAL